MTRLPPTTKVLLTLATAAGLASVATGRASATPYLQTDLVSSVAGLATITDPALIIILNSRRIKTEKVQMRQGDHCTACPEMSFWSFGRH